MSGVAFRLHWFGVVPAEEGDGFEVWLDPPLGEISKAPAATYDAAVALAMDLGRANGATMVQNRKWERPQ